MATTSTTRLLHPTKPLSISVPNHSQFLSTSTSTSDSPGVVEPSLTSSPLHPVHLQDTTHVDHNLPTPLTFPPDSFPSTTEEDSHSRRGGRGGGIGLGVDPDVLSRQERRLHLRAIEDMNSRRASTATGTLVEGTTTTLQSQVQPLSSPIEVLNDGAWKQHRVGSRLSGSGAEDDDDEGEGGGSSSSTPLVPFPAFQASPSSRSLHLTPLLSQQDLLDRDLPPLPDSPPPTSSISTATNSITTDREAGDGDMSSNSSTLSLPSVPPVDLALPNHSTSAASGTYVSVASGPLARLSPSNNHPAQDTNTRTSSPHSRSARSFFSNLLHRSPRSPHTPSSPFSASSSSIPRSPSAPTGAFTTPPNQSSQWTHGRSSSLPSSPNLDTQGVRGFTESRSSLALNGGERERERFGGTLGGGGSPPPMLARSNSNTGGGRTAPPSPLAGGSAGGGFSSSPNTPLPPTTPSPVLIPPTLASAGLNLVPLTQTLSISRNSQPLCGAILDNKYILIGTTGGLDFLPIPLPGSLPMKLHGSSIKKRRETRKPISLIKRTRFKDLAVLSERSNILLAIAGRNDHIRVYALDGIRAMIEKKMAEIDIRDGYPIIPDPSILTPKPISKGKAKAEPPPPPPTPSPHSLAPQPSPPPDYSFGLPPPPPSPRGRRSPAPTPISTSSSFSNHSHHHGPPSPSRTHHSSVPQGGSLVRAVPTNPRPPNSRSSSSSSPTSPRSTATSATLRGSKSREFIANRKTSTTAVMTRRKSKVDLNSTTDGGGGGSRRSSIYSGDEGRGYSGLRRGSTSSALGGLGLPLPPPPPTNIPPEFLSSATTATDGPLPLPPLPPLPQHFRERTNEDENGEDGGDEAEPSTFNTLYPPRTASGLSGRRSSAGGGGESAWTSELSLASAATSLSPSYFRSTTTTTRLEPRRPSTAGSMTRTQDLAEFLRTSGPSGVNVPPSPVMEEIRTPTPSTSKSNFRSGSFDLPVSYQQENGVGPSRNNSVSSITSSLKIPREPRTSDRFASTFELAEFLRTTGGDGTMGDMEDRRRGSASSSTSQGRLEPRLARLPPLRSFERSSAMELAELLRETGPEEGAMTFSSPASRRGSATTGAGGSRRSSANGGDPFSSLPRSVSAPINRSQPNFSNPFGAPSSSSTSTNVKGKSTQPPVALEETLSSTTRANLTPPMASSELRRSVSARARLVARSPTTRDTDDGSGEDEEDPITGLRRKKPAGLTLEEIIRNGPPSSGAENEAAGGSGGNSPSLPGNRSSKRWTMTNMSHLLLNRPGTSSDQGHRAPSPTCPEDRTRSSMDNRRSSLQWDTTSEPAPPGTETTIVPMGAPPSRLPTPPPPPPPRSTTPLASTPLPPHDFKRANSELLNAERPTLPPSSQLPPDAHPANSSSPLEYVKLARTKGARLLRAVETKKRTYLAVLCGEEGERIELFTGSRSISLSLNRTFVLPENPRTIEFQIQGDDLIDIYLVYPESIFALEPATVRVREVGVGRGERRARRERERRTRDLVAQTTVEGEGEGGSMSPLGTPNPSSSSLHPADPAIFEGRPPRTPSPAGEDDSNGDFDPLAPGDNPPPNSLEAENPPPPPPRPGSARPSTPGQSPRETTLSGSRTKLPYTTFQQLGFVPPVPSSVLASAWIIPPLYTDVVAGQDQSPLVDHPSITVTQSGAIGSAPPIFQDQPLLSPISLLGGAAQRANGPPGLFFVSKGRNLSGIVTGDGRSVIKKPLVWNLDRQTDGDPGGDLYRRIEMVIVGGTRTVVVGVGATEVKAIAVGGEAWQAPFGVAIPVTPTPGTRASDVREIEFLGNHLASNQLFFTERVGQTWRAWCIGAVP